MPGTSIKVGEVYARLSVVSEAGKNKAGSKLFACNCSCGKTGVFVGSRLKRGETRSCGCFHAEVTSKIASTHGKSGSGAHRSWAAMLERCNSERNIGYANYGGRGITVCEEWRKFEAFYQDMGDRPQGMTLDRIDPNGNYCKDNCRWLSKKMQNRNRRDNRLFEFQGKGRTIPEIAEMVGLKEPTLRRRLMTVVEPLEIAVRPAIVKKQYERRA